MVKDAIKTGFEPAYLLADTWFMCDTLLFEIQKIKIRYAKKLHVISLMKTNRSIKMNGYAKDFFVYILVVALIKITNYGNKNRVCKPNNSN